MSGDWDHVVLATSLPLLPAPGTHALEAWETTASRTQPAAILCDGRAATC